MDDGMEGYIKLHRKMLDNPIVYKDKDYLALWIYLLLNATHSSRDVVFGGKRTTLLPGQLITGREALAKEIKVDVNKVERMLKRLKIEQQIEQQTSNKNRIITIVNWDKYQGREQQIEQPVNNNRTTGEQQVNTNKNVKNDNNVNNDLKNKDSASASRKQDAEALFENLWSLYPLKRGKGSVSDANKRRLLDIGLDEMVRAIDRYKADLAKEDWRKPQNGSRFFNSGHIDYLDGNYKAPPKQDVKPTAGKSNGFHNFNQRDTDYDAIMLQRLKERQGEDHHGE